MQKTDLSLDKCIYICMKDGHWWTFWDLRRVIYRNTGKHYGEPTISAGIRNLRKDYNREFFNLPRYPKEIIVKKRIEGSKGYKYRLIME
tara:strand:+ start:1040 stop:1306 length:267 start_codon:yes stop_codon:yes gene_type:complete